MKREFEASPATMGGGIENMSECPEVLYSMSLPFLRIDAEVLHREKHVRLEEGSNKRARTDGSYLRLEEGLCGLREEFRLDCAAQFRVFVSGKQRGLCPEMYEQIYFISREAVENAIRHSAATVVEAEVMYEGRALHVFIRDNGCGMDQQAIRTGKNANRGLLGMRERAESLGGEFRIWSKVGAGTEIEVSVPLVAPVTN